MRGDSLAKFKDNWFLDSLDNRIIYRKQINNKAVKIYTPYTKEQIKKAQSFVDQKLLEMFSKNADAEKREKSGVINSSIKDLYFECLKERDAKSTDRTKYIYKNEWAQSLSKFWDNKTIIDMNEQTINLFETWYIKNMSKRVFFNTRKCLNMLINYLWNNGYLKHIERKPKVSDLDKEVLNYKNKKKPVGRVYTDSEIKDILRNADKRTKLGVIFGRFLGTRKMEFLTAKWSQVDWSKNEIEIWSFKNKKWRRIPMPTILRNELEVWRQENQKIKTEYIFFAPRNHKTHISSQVFDKGWTTAKEKAKISLWDVENAARVHDLRHSFASQTADEGWPVRVACEILDMSIKEYERTYTHVSKSAKSALMMKGFAKWK